MVESDLTIIEALGEDFYFWNLRTIPEAISESLASKINELKSKFAEKFFSINRGDTKSLKFEISSLIKALHFLIPNIKLDELIIAKYFEELFNEYHYEETNLLPEKANEILRKTKIDYKLNQTYSPLFGLNEKTLDLEERAFLNDIFEEKNFETERIFKKFNKYISGFIVDYNNNPNAENNIRMYIMKIEEEYIHQMRLIISIIQEKIFNSIQEAINSNELQRIIITMNKIDSVQDVQENHWETASEEIFCKEEIILKQVIRLSSNLLVFNLSFETSNCTNLIIFRDFQSKFLQAIPDKDIIVCSGSEVNSFVLFNNNTKQCIIGCIRDDKEFISLKEFSFSPKPIEKIISACYIKKNKELICINPLGEISSSKNAIIGLSLIDNEHFHTIVISECKNYLIFHSKAGLKLYTLDLKEIFIYAYPVLQAFIQDNALIALCVNNEQKGSITRVRLSDLEIDKTRGNYFVLDKVHAELSKSISFAREIYTDFFNPNRYRVEKSEVMPSPREIILESNKSSKI